MKAKDLLKEKEIRPSVIRIKVLEYLLEHKVHPTVDEVFNSLMDEIPTLSKTSVYNTLSLLEENDLINSISIDRSNIRYDADSSLHGHFKCSECGSVSDFAVGKIKSALPEGFHVKTQEVYFTGICENCKKEKE